MKAKFYVPFETAKLLKEKGYPQGDSDMYYDLIKGKLKHNDEITGIYTIAEFAQRYVSVPAYCEVIDWLAGQEIYIDVDRTIGRIISTSRWHCYIWDSGKYDCAMITCSYPIREDAINEAIIKVLKDMI